MPANRELLESLRDSFENLEVLDKPGLNSLRDRAHMIIRRVFGANSPYLERLSKIRFHPGSVPIVSSSGRGSVSPAEAHRQERAWGVGAKKSL